VETLTRSGLVLPQENVANDPAFRHSPQAASVAVMIAGPYLKANTVFSTDRLLNRNFSFRR
jgi:hypothetical protein